MLMFRATDVYKNVTVTVYSGSELIMQTKKRIVRPGEMQTLNLKENQINKINQVKQPITVSIELPEDAID